MTDEPQPMIPRSYGCSFGCGNPYDYIIVTVADGTAEFPCLPCFLRLAKDMVEAVLNPDDPNVVAALADLAAQSQATVNGAGPKRRGHNAPVDNEDPDLLEAFDSAITADELPEEFR